MERVAYLAANPVVEENDLPLSSHQLSQWTPRHYLAL